MENRYDEHYLVLQAQAGSKSAFAMLYRSYNPSLIRFSYRLCGDRQAAADAVQDAWLTVFRKLDTLNEPGVFRSFVFRAVRWRTLDYLRKRQDYYENLDEQLIDEDVPWATSNQISRLVAKLPEVEREAIYLFYLEDMTLIEIAQVLEIPTGTVKSRLNRARTKLKILIDGD